MITNMFFAHSLWPVNGISVTSPFRGKLQVSDDSKSNDFKIHHNGIFHAGFSNVTKCSATLVWYSFSLAAFSVSVYGCIILPSIFIAYIPSCMEAWPFMLFITPNIKSSLMNNLLARYFMQRARVWNSKRIMKINTDGNTPMKGIVTFTMFPVYT